MRRPVRARSWLRAGGALLFALTLGACSHAPPVAVEPAGPPVPDAAPNAEAAPHARGAQRGDASYYADSFEGHRTASGETYSGDDLTAAHRWLPFGTRVRVTNVRNGRSVEVVINDRGPFRAGRVIDVSRRAAEALGLVRDGVAPVRVEVVDLADGDLE